MWRPGDPTLDWVLRRAVAGQVRHPGAGGVRATGLLTRPGSPLRVAGCATTGGGLAADLVVDATGRAAQSTRGCRLLAQGGAGPAGWRMWPGLLQSDYRLRPGAALPGPETTRAVLALDEFTPGSGESDNHTMLIAIAPLIQTRGSAASPIPMASPQW